MALVFGSIMMGTGIATMHYTGMEAMRLPAILISGVASVSAKRPQTADA